jgi:hypothetical protein
MNWNAQLWRTAQRIEAAYRGQGSRCQTSAPAAWAWNNVLASERRRRIAARKEWRCAEARERERLAADLDTLLGQLRTLRSGLQSPHRRMLPNVAELYAELLAAQEEFGTVAVDGSEVYVTTAAITLEEVYLGPFEIRLDLARLGEQEPYRVAAVEPHPAASRSTTIHPHVDSETACLGEGKAAISAALEEGRLGDLFLLIDRVLHTYGEGSAFVELANWFGTDCRDCGDAVDEDEISTCGKCDAELCESCVRSCSQCGTSRCSDCATTCTRCEDTTCSGCLQACEHCEDELCANCLSEGVCDACRERMEEEELEECEEPAEEPEELPEPSVHADVMGEARVPAGPRRRRNRRLRNLIRR